ncbi:MAG TPA: TetR/AcrR family transcriptional regulator [Streptosporangiaceae bacterium]|nr:TetR/AcrR family transcriptional regulator [Streptosporangiaceae bacterium]
MPKVVDHAQRRRELVAATWAVVAAEGIEAATVRRIAEEAGCTTGRITHYFADKEEVLVAALRQVHRAAGKRMLAAIGPRSGLEALRAVLAEALPLDQKRILEWRVWLAFWGSAATSTSLQAEQHQRYREWRGLLKRVLATAQLSADIDLDRLVDQIVALVDGFGLQGVLDPQHPQLEQLASRLNGAVDALIRAADG